MNLINIWKVFLAIPLANICPYGFISANLYL